MKEICIWNVNWINKCIVRCNDNHIISAIIALYGTNTLCAVVDYNDSLVISVIAIENYYKVHCFDKEFFTETPVQAVQNIIFENAVYKPRLFPLHGGGIEIDGNAQLFFAPTQSGKTTLITYLTQKGYPYINDDCILIGMDTLCVVPDISPIHLRPESIPVLAQYGCVIYGNEINVENIHRIVYSPQKNVSDELPVGNIFFIERSLSENSCHSIPRNKAVQLLMAALISPKANDSSRLKCAIKLASKCKRLIYSDMRYVSDLLDTEDAR